MTTRPALADMTADCGHQVQARHALVLRDGKWVCTACSLPTSGLIDFECPSCGLLITEGHRISLGYDGEWRHMGCAGQQVLASVSVEEAYTTWSNVDPPAATLRGSSDQQAPSVWGVHDRVRNYQAAFVTADGDTVWQQGKSGTSGCGWYRIVLPLNELARHGWRVGYRAASLPDDDSYRTVVGQRLDKPEALMFWRKLRLGHRLVYETDDDIFSVPPERWVNATYAADVMQDAVLNAALTAHVVTVSTEPLAEVFRAKGCPDVRVLPNCVPGALLDLPKPAHRGLVVGWAGGGSHGYDMQMISGRLAKFVDEHKRAELHFIGSDFREVVGRGGRFSSWVPSDESLDYYRLFDFDIGIAPLRGTRFDRSKSAIKALEYMALGIPVIASDAESYRGIVVDGVNGYLCRRLSDWTKRLHELASDRDAREEMGRKAREMAREHTIEANWRRWAAVYDGP